MPSMIDAQQLKLLQGLCSVRVAGVLLCDAVHQMTAAGQPRMFIALKLRAGPGPVVHAQVDVGTDVADQMKAQEVLCYLRRNALVSVGAAGVEVRHVHGEPVLWLVRPHGLVVPVELLHPAGNPAATVF